MKLNKLNVFIVFVTAAWVSAFVPNLSLIAHATIGFIMGIIFPIFIEEKKDNEKK